MVLSPHRGMNWFFHKLYTPYAYHADKKMCIIQYNTTGLLASQKECKLSPCPLKVYTPIFVTT